ncbi:ATP11 protein-domain-containing protein [Pelagophyceae sp. CCMP2097]|nr:ATP11 protein-domain-containing protein [Pelagophyceae sp. CCMP2097]
MPWARALRGGVARARQFSGYSEYARGGHAGHVSRKLGDIVKIPLLLREEPSVVEQIWKTYHDERHDAVGLTLPARNATMLVDRAQAAPMFIFPVHRDGGYFSLVSQLQSRRHFIFTYLEDFKRNPNGARPHLTLTLHDDLAKEKGAQQPASDGPLPDAAT